jgi:hypothetical protein
MHEINFHAGAALKGAGVGEATRVRRAVFCADKGIRSAFALTHMIHVDPVSFDELLED